MSTKEKQLKAARERLTKLREQLGKQPVPQTLTAARRKMKIMQQIMDTKEKIARIKKSP